MKRQKKKNPVIQHWYHIYLNNPSQRNEALIELAKIFKIPIDRTRIEDYHIIKCDAFYLSLEKEAYKGEEKVTYVSHLKGILDKESLDCQIEERHSNYSKTVIYDLVKNKCLKKIITIKDQDFLATIEHDDKDSKEFFKNFGKKVSLRLFKINQNQPEEIYETTFTKLYSKETVNGMETINTYNVQPNSRYGNKVDKYCLQSDKGYIYGINCLEKKGISMTVTGLCVENAHVPYQIYKPPFLDMRGHNNREYDIDSLMIFQGTYNNVSNFVEIEKKGQDLIIKFYGKTKEQEKTEPVVLHLSGASDSTITIDELDHIEGILSLYFQGNPLVEIVVEELKHFEAYLLNQREEALNPKDFIECDFNVLEKTIVNQKDEFMRQLKSDFKTLSKDQRILQKGLTRTLKKDY